jgi:hypothetical protein
MKGPFDDALPNEATNVMGGQPCFRCGGMKREAATFPPFGRPPDDPALCVCEPRPSSLIVHYPAPGEKVPHGEH